MMKGDRFQDRDCYLFEPFEEAFFHWDHRRRTIRMKFVGQEVDVEVPHDHRIFNDAIRSGREVDRVDYDCGSVPG
ncbi:hypothetical protein [Sphingomonas sp. TDK1]|uniref:hypothetical protein n=1 Tax=Sphingomonas sp. TDK1 TaxID=453247 RepID=UPI0007D9C68E|nr:hypothetical protein [Sphingomonas sp. TDK1]OAN67192.1 hypothetical protein A7X12_00780 [Sphingomonas sp. TDK1]